MQKKKGWVVGLAAALGKVDQVTTRQDQSKSLCTQRLSQQSCVHSIRIGFHIQTNSSGCIGDTEVQVRITLPVINGGKFSEIYIRIPMTASDRDPSSVKNQGLLREKQCSDERGEHLLCPSPRQH
jgi:hypothetical protein